MSLDACHKYSLKPPIAFLTLLFYQYSYLRDLDDNQKDNRIVHMSYYEDNIHLNVAIVSKDINGHVVSINRFLFKKYLYDKIYKIYSKSEPIVIDDGLLDLFNKMYQEEKKQNK